MTKKIIFSAFVLSFLAFAEVSKAECDGFYIAGRLGQAKIEVKDARGNADSHTNDGVTNKKRLMVSGAVGYRYEHWRAELEYVWRKRNSESPTEFSKHTFKSKSYMFVVYYDFFPYTWFTPFVSAGIGYTKNSLTNSLNLPSWSWRERMKDNSFTWSLGAGISAKITNRLIMDIGYRYYDMGDGELNVYNGKTETDAHEVYMGLRYVL